jgi:hypothetical protein
MCSKAVKINVIVHDKWYLITIVNLVLNCLNFRALPCLYVWFFYYGVSILFCRVLGPFYMRNELKLGNVLRSL